MSLTVLISWFNKYYSHLCAVHSAGNSRYVFDRRVKIKKRTRSTSSPRISSNHGFSGP